PLPMVVIGRMLGVPSGDLGRLEALTTDVFAIFNSPVATEEAIATCYRGGVATVGYSRELIAARRHPGNADLISDLIRVEEQVPDRGGRRGALLAAPRRGVRVDAEPHQQRRARPPAEPGSARGCAGSPRPDPRCGRRAPALRWAWHVGGAPGDRGCRDWRP